MFSTTWAGTPAWVENLQLGIPPPPSSTMWTQGSGLQPRGKKRESGEDLYEAGRCWRGAFPCFLGALWWSQEPLMCQSFVGWLSTSDFSGIVHVILDYWGQALLVKMWSFVVYFLKEIRQHLLETSTAATRMRAQSTYYKVAQFHGLSVNEDPEIRLWKGVPSWAPYQWCKQRVPISPSLVHVYSLSLLYEEIWNDFKGRRARNDRLIRDTSLHVKLRAF